MSAFEQSNAAVAVRKDGRLAIIELCDPPMNWLTLDRLEALADAVEHFDADPDVAVIVIRGAGDRWFSAGAPVEEFATAYSARLYNRAALRAFTTIRQCGRPVIAAINGSSAAEGSALHLWCDLALAVDQAKLSHPELRLGAMPSIYTAQGLPHHVGEKIAKQIVFLGSEMSAGEAVRIGWINWCVPRENFEEELRGICNELAQRSPLAVRIAKVSGNFEGDLLFPGVTHAALAGSIAHIHPEVVGMRKAFPLDPDV